MELSERCGAWMPVAKTRCGRTEGHDGPHSTPESMERQREYERSPERRRYKTQWGRVNDIRICPVCGGMKQRRSERCKDCAKRIDPQRLRERNAEEA